MEMRRTTLGEGALALTQQMVISPPCLNRHKETWLVQVANGSMTTIGPWPPIWCQRNSYSRVNANWIKSVLNSIMDKNQSAFILERQIIDNILLTQELLKGYHCVKGPKRDLQRRKAKVSWKEVCQPKQYGGLGFKSLDQWNQALLVKHLWNVAAKKDSL
ncbi:hypothetical protein Tco_0492897 [Tanacetum coccineum]